MANAAAMRVHVPVNTGSNFKYEKFKHNFFLIDKFNEKLVNYKLYNFLRSTTFVFVVLDPRLFKQIQS